MSQKIRNTITQKKVQEPINPSPITNEHALEKNEGKFSSISKTESILAAVLALLVFCCVAWNQLVVNNSDMLFMAQSRSFFTTHFQFFKELTTTPGCAIAWLGSYLTQYFYNPSVGSCILIAIWSITYFCIKKAFKLNNFWAFAGLIPLVCLLISTIDLGYWMYYLKHPGYFFRESLGFLFMVSCFFIGTRLSKNWIAQCIFTIIITAVGYYACGYHALLFTLYLPINEWINGKSDIKSKVFLTIVAGVSLIAIPQIAYNNFFTEMRSETAWFGGFPHFEMDAHKSITCQYPFFALCISPLVLIFVSKLQEKIGMNGFAAYLNRLVLIGSLIAIPYIVDAYNFDDYNYHAEFRMYKATDEGRWDDVLEESVNYQDTPTREMVLLNHIAIINKGTLGHELFKYNNFGKEPLSTDSLPIHLVQTAGPLIYYHHAKTNFAYRWCIENSVEYNYNFNELKIMVRCALIAGEWDVARKYIDILKTSTFYKDWAEKYEPILEDHSKIKEYKEFDLIRELYEHMGTVLDGDNGLCEMYLLNYFANTMNKDSKVLEELTLAYALIQKDIQLFWPRFFLYAQMHKGEEMPIHYQEAAFLYGNLEHQVDISSMPFTHGLPERYASFQQVSQSYLSQGMSVEQVRDAMRGDFGNTFWWFYFFCRDVKSY